ncbi:hypothetical protein XELAEV_18037128mg [Xenopus laevis]|uniref:Uncharacterized protein n=1 Tax=Xenopus laevis TaxID=8355 RepID=A0A974CCN9_XENLA|nr:hypothetical protein XELAEV_18037128mg [Xenopus laevis]
MIASDWGGLRPPGNPTQWAPRRKSPSPQGTGLGCRAPEGWGPLCFFPVSCRPSPTMNTVIKVDSLYNCEIIHIILVS